MAKTTVKKTISVVIPTYNRETYVAAAIDSVLAQKLPKGWAIEIIVADDGSTDKTIEILKSYGNKVKVLELQHSGKPAVPRNAAIKVAKGELIAFQDSDDLWAPDRLAKQIPHFNDMNVVLCFGQAEIVDEKGKRTGQLVVNEKILDSAKSFESLLQQNAISTLTVTVRRDVVLGVGCFDESDDVRAIEDYELWLRIAVKHSGGLCPLKDVLAYYRRHDKNISTGDALKGLNDALTIYRKIWISGQLDYSQQLLVEGYVEKFNKNYVTYTKTQDNIKKPSISVVMSVYNGGHLLRPAIDSILNQSFKDFEFIIINDGSTDRSDSLITSYRDPRIRLINQTNHGLVYSLNKAIRLSRGEYIARMDADDISHVNRLKEQYKVLKFEKNIGLLGTFFEYIDESGKNLHKKILYPFKDIDIRRAFYLMNPIGHGTVMFRRDAFEEAGGYIDTYGPTEDYELWRRFHKHWKIEVLPMILYHYRINSTGISQIQNDTQRTFTNMIIEEEWSKPFIKKSALKILIDAKFYRSMSSNIFDIFSNYSAQQEMIAKQLLARYKLRYGIPTTLAVMKLQPHNRKLFAKLLIQSITGKLRINK